MWSCNSTSVAYVWTALVSLTVVIAKAEEDYPVPVPPCLQNLSMDSSMFVKFDFVISHGGFTCWEEHKCLVAYAVLHAIWW